MNGFFWDVTPCGSYKNRVSDERNASFIRVTRIGELGRTLGVTSNRRSVMKEALSSFQNFDSYKNHAA
jgi:hypothetical protein